MNAQGVTSYIKATIQINPRWNGRLLFYCVIFLLTGQLNNYFAGEDFFVFHWAETHNYLDAIKNWYLVNGRIGNAIYWITEYKLLGYKPMLIHFISFIVNP